MLYWVRGGGETGSQGWRKKSETNGGVVGPRTGKVPTVVWAVPFRVGHAGEWSGRASACGRTRPHCHTFLLFLPGQRWHPGVNGGVCWSGSSRTVGTNGAPDQTARRMTSPLGLPTVSVH